MMRPITAVCGATLVLGCAAIAWAGNNAGGAVRLSWNPASLTETVSPGGSRAFPLFLSVRGAPDLQQLALHLSWSPWDAAGGCYGVLPGGPAGSYSASASPPPDSSFGGDSSFTWTLLFPPGATDRSGVFYWVSPASCVAAPPPRFSVTDARAMDSGGAFDTLQYLGCALVLAAAGEESAVALAGAPVSDAVSDAAPAPTRLALEVGPNPAAGEIVLRFSLPGPMPYRLGIYDLGGRLVLRPHPQVENRRGSFRWDLQRGDGRRASPGRYFARLITPAGVRVAAITVVE